MLISPKYTKYQDPERNITLRKNIDGITPYKVTLPEPPHPEKIANFGLPVEKQFFQREIVPNWVWKMTRTAQKKGKEGISGRIEVLDIVRRNKDYESFVASQWEKKNNGFWIYIYGKPVYITPKHWHYCNYYYLDDGLPDFRFIDAEYYYWWEEVVEKEPWVYGGIEMTMRRDGKSYRGGNSCLFNATSELNYHVGMQSKTNDDAKDLFQRVVVLPWRKLPFYFSPKYDNKTYPVKEIKFRDSDSEIEFDEDDTLAELTSDELHSSIEARSTVHTAFDGQKLGFYFDDECGKTEEMLISQAWRVHKQCLRVRDRVVGKALLTTTIEETTKGGLIEFKKVWNQSDHDPTKLTALGQTKSGLVRFFKGAPETYKFDQFGASIINDPLPYQMEWLKSKGDRHFDKGGAEMVDIEINAETDPIERQKIIHMYPRTIREALRTNPKDCEFNMLKIDERLDDFLYGNDDVVVGNLAWENNEKDTKVIFTECENGRWLFKRALIEYLIDTSNNVFKHSSDGCPAPGNKHAGTIGADPYKYNATNSDRRSLGTAMAFMNLILEVEEGRDEEDYLTDDYIMQYGWRFQDKRRYGEDMIMSCHFLGMPIFPEINVASLWDYITERGYHHFLKYRNIVKKKKKGSGVKIEESKTPGMTTLGDAIKEPVFGLVGTYIETSARRCVFSEFLQDCKDVEYGNWNPFDYFVAGGYAIYGSKGGAMRKKQANPEPENHEGMLWDLREY